MQHPTPPATAGGVLLPGPPPTGLLNTTPMVVSGRTVWPESGAPQAKESTTMFRTHTNRRRLGLATGVLLAASALAIPAGASASTTVEADRTPEGNKGLTEA